MMLQHLTNGSQAVGVLTETSDKSYHLCPIEYIVDREGNLVQTPPDGVWLNREAWAVI